MTVLSLLLLSRDEVLSAYLSAVLFGRATVTGILPGARLPAADVLLIDLGTAEPPEPLPDLPRVLTTGYTGTPDLLRPFTDADLLALLFPEDAPERLTFDPARRRVSVGGASLVLPEREAILFGALFSAGGRVVSRAALTRLVFGDDKPRDNLLQVYLCRLRSTLGARFGIRIPACRAEGYRLEIPESEQ